VDTPDVAALLAEPPARTAHLFRTHYARTMLAGNGLVLFGAGLADDHRARLEAAGIPLVAAGAGTDDLDRARRATYPAQDDVEQASWGIGCPAPSLVLVGEVDPRASPWPLFSGSGFWLYNALRELGHDELTYLVGNAYRGEIAQTQSLRAVWEAVARHAPIVVALGKASAAALRDADVPHVEVPHPAWARRFAYGEGPAGLAKRMHDAGVPAGRWRSVVAPDAPPLPVVPVGKAPAWVDATNLPRVVGHRPRRRKKDRSRVSRSRIERARRLFVTGDVETVKDAVIKAGLPEGAYSEVLARYRDEAWQEERERQVDRVREAFYRDAADAEAKALTASRQVASSALLDALTLVQRRLHAVDEKGQPTFVVKPSDAKALAETVAILDARGDGRGQVDAKLSELRALPPHDQARELVRTLKAQFGEDVVKPKDAP